MNAYEKRKFAIKYAQYERLLVLQGYAKATIDNYTRSIRRLAAWIDRCPDKRITKNPCRDTHLLIDIITNRN